MTYAVDLSNLALEANGAGAGITANATAISAISVGNSTVNSSINATALVVGSNVATFGTAVYHVANGNVGIANTTPSNTLSVTGTASISGALTTGSNTATFGTTLYSVANGNVGIGTSSPASKLDVAGTITASAAAGTHTLDTSGATVSVANGGTVAFSSASGMFLVNNHNLGSVTIWLVGGGSTSAVSYVGATVGSVAYTVGIGGYTFTNNSGSTATFSFMFFRTRNTA